MKYDLMKLIENENTCYVVLEGVQKLNTVD